MNGPAKMYSLRPIVRRDVPVELPSCMYSLANIHTKCVHDGTIATGSIQEGPLPDISHQNNSSLSGMADLQQRQEYILKQLEELKGQMLSIRKSLSDSGVVPVAKAACSVATKPKTVKVNIKDIPEIVLNVDPNHPPYSLLILRKLWQNSVDLHVETYMHSTASSLPEATKQFCEQLKEGQTSNGVPKINARLIWKNIGANNLELIASTVPILGECNLLRYISRLTSTLNYDESNYEIDSFLDLSHKIVNAKTKSERALLLQQVTKKQGKSKFLFGSEINVADVALYSAIKQAAANEINAGLKKWMVLCESV